MNNVFFFRFPVENTVLETAGKIISKNALFQSYSHLSEFLFIPSSFQLEISVHPYIHTNLSCGDSSSYVMSFCRMESTRNLEKTWVFCWFLWVKICPVLVGAFHSAPPSSLNPFQPDQAFKGYDSWVDIRPHHLGFLGICLKKSIKNGKKTHPQNRIVREKHHIFLLHDGSEIPNNQLGWVLKPCKEWEKTNSKPQLISQISAINITNLSTDRPFWFGQGTALLSRPIWNLIVYLKKLSNLSFPWMVCFWWSLLP